MPIVFMTGNDNEGTRQAAMEGGCIVYLRKPFSAKSLMDAVVKASAELTCWLPPVKADAAPAPRCPTMPLLFRFSAHQSYPSQARESAPSRTT